MVITEKIDGTNGLIFICNETFFGPGDLSEDLILHKYEETTSFGAKLVLMAGSRTRWITPKSDNFRFAAWVQDHAEELLHLGEGHHYGEWWGCGIQRQYDLKEKRFSLFDHRRWNEENTPPDCCSVVPVLYKGPYKSGIISDIKDELFKTGSVAAPGYMRPEGVVINYAYTSFRGLLKDFVYE